MAAQKKNFESISTGRVYNAIATATAEEPKQAEPATDKKDLLARRSRNADPTPEQLRAAQEQNKTQGRRGCRATRINMAFTPEVHEYIVTMARVRGESITQFTNYIFKKSMTDNAELYEQAKAFKNSI